MAGISYHIRAGENHAIAASIPSLVAPGTGTIAANNTATERLVPDWQRRGPVDRMLVRRER